MQPSQQEGAKRRSGRPPGTPMRRVCITMPQEQYEVLSKTAQEADVSLSRVVRAAIEEWVEET